MSMPCFAVRQPWASLIMAGTKDVENRSRPWPRTIPLPATALILASKKFDNNALRTADTPWPDLNIPLMSLPDDWLEAHFQAILGTVLVTGCRQDSKSPWAQPGRWHWLLADSTPFAQPIPFVAGRRGVFRAPDVEALHRPHDGSTRRVDVREELADVMITRPGPWGNPYIKARLADRLHELRGKRLGCFCRADQRCHGDVLVRLVEEYV